MKKYIRKFLKFIKYSIVGGICTIINLILFYVFVQAGVHYIGANVVSYLLAVVLNYILNKCFVFLKNSDEKRVEREARQFCKFFVIRLLTMLLDNIFFYVFVTIWGKNVYFTRIILTMEGLFFSYFFINKFVFQKRKIRDER